MLAAREEQPDVAIPRDGVDVASRLLAGEQIVVADVLDVNLRCSLRVVETLRGKNIPSNIKIAFRGVNMERRAGAAAFDPRIGERAVFVLGPALDSHGEPDGTGLASPRGGFRARIPLPQEGSEALLDAMRGIVQLQDGSDQAAADRSIASWLQGENPWLLDVALDFAARFRLDDEDAVRALLVRTRETSPQRRRRAVEALGQWLAPNGRSAESGAALQELQATALETIVRLARIDEDVQVRRVAVHQLVSLAPEDVLDLLRAIAKEDPAQEVRYEAAAGVHNLSRANSIDNGQSPR